MSQARKIAEWHAWYADRSTYSSSKDKWEDLPTHGVVHVLVLFDDGSKELLNGNDLYFKFGELMQNDNDRDGLLRKFDNVKFGTWVEPNVFREVFEEADAIGQEWHRKHYDHKHRPN